MNRWTIVGFMGTADGGRIKVSVNCKGSAEFTRGETTMQICQSFCFKCSVVQENTLIHCVSFCFDVPYEITQIKLFDFKCGVCKRLKFVLEILYSYSESMVEKVASHQISSISTFWEAFWTSYQ